VSRTGENACETRLMLLVLARLMKLEEQGQPIHPWRNNVGAAIDKTGRKVTFGEPGASDIMCVVRGGFVAIETKSADGRVSEDQKTWRDKVLPAGAVYIVAKCLEEAIDPVLELLGLTGRATWNRDHWEIAA
jgi:hypothetical protein